MKIKIFFCVCFLVTTSLFLAAKAGADDPLHIHMISPLYRNAIYSTMADPKTIKFRAKVSLSDPGAQNIKIIAYLKRNGEVLKTLNFYNLSSNTIIDFPVDDINFENTRSGPYVEDDSPYQFDFYLMRDNSVKLDFETAELHKYPPPPAGVKEVRIDDNGNLVIDGQKEFVFGTYAPVESTATENVASLNFLNSLGFDAFLNLPAGAKYFPAGSGIFTSIRYIAALTDFSLENTRSIVSEFREKPDMMVYYMFDEPNNHPDDIWAQPDFICQNYDLIKKLDPYHPGAIAWKITPNGVALSTITSYENCQDIMGFDVYPVYADSNIYPINLRNVTYNYELLRFPDKYGYSNFDNIDSPVYGIPQMWGDNISNRRMPNHQEQKNMVFQYLSCGSSMIFPYKYHYDGSGEEYDKYWQYYQTDIIPQVAGIKDALFAPRKNGTTVPFPQGGLIEVDSSDPSILSWSYRKTENKEYVFLVNTSSKWNKSGGADTNNDYRWYVSPKDKKITIDIIFLEQGQSTVNALIKDSSMPDSYQLREGKMTLELDGVNDFSSGVLVLERSTEVEQIPTQTCDQRGKGIAPDVSILNLLDLIELEKRYLKLSNGEMVDINLDQRQDFSDIVSLSQCLSCIWDWDCM